MLPSLDDLFPQAKRPTVEHSKIFDWPNSLWSVHAERIPEHRFSDTIYTWDIAGNSEFGRTFFVRALVVFFQRSFGRKKEVDSQNSGELCAYKRHMTPNCWLWKGDDIISMKWPVIYFGARNKAMTNHLRTHKKGGSHRFPLLMENLNTRVSFPVQYISWRIVI